MGVGSGIMGGHVASLVWGKQRPDVFRGINQVRQHSSPSCTTVETIVAEIILKCK